MIEETRIVLIEKADLSNWRFYWRIRTISEKLRPNVNGRHVEAYITGKWLKDSRIRKTLINSGFDVYDAMDTKDTGYIRRNKK